MALLDFLFGKKEKFEQLPTITPEQSQLLKLILSTIKPGQLNIQQQPTFKSGQNFLEQILGGDTEAFEAPLMRQFQEQIIPALAERFAGGFGIPGAASAQSSSAFQQALGSAGADLSERLGSLRGQLQMQAVPQALGYAQAPAQSQLGLLSAGLGTRGFENIFRPSTSGLLGSLLGGGLGGLLGGFGQIGSNSIANRFLR